MCGLFGFVAAGSSADPHLLEQLGHLAARRGPHAWGMAWIDRPGGGIERHAEITRYRGGPIVRGVIDATAVIGHCRMATSGSWERRENVQPLRYGAGAVAHNGVVRDLGPYLGLVDVDSEALIRAADAEGLDRALELATEGNHAILFLFPERVVAFRRGLPLHVRSDSKGVYFCSWRFEGSEPLSEGHAVTFDLDNRAKP
jgi:predicted glutamine amidotransferase